MTGLAVSAAPDRSRDRRSRHGPTRAQAISDALGGHCISLRRTEIGPFRVDEADENRIVPLDEALGRVAAAS